MVYTTEKTLRENEDKIPADLKEQVEGKIAAVRSALLGQDMDHLRSTVQELSEVLQQIGAAVYQQQEPPPGSEGFPGGPPDEGGPEDGSVEGEFREV